MNEMIPPIGPRTPASGVETDRDKRPSKAPPDTVSTLLADKRKTTDAVSIRTGFTGDAESMKQSMALIMDKVAQQMMRVFPDNPELREKYGLPENIEEYSMEKLQDYFSPEKTASRIVGFTTSFFGAYQANHPDENGKTQATGFTELIRNAIKKGFNEALEVLGDLDELGEIGENIERTYNIVMEQIDEFQDEKLELLGDDSLRRVEPEPPLEPLAEEMLPPPEDTGIPRDESGGDPLDVTA